MRAKNYWTKPGTIIAKNFAVRSSCLFVLSIGSLAAENWQSVELGLTISGFVASGLYESTR